MLAAVVQSWDKSRVHCMKAGIPAILDEIKIKERILKMESGRTRYTLWKLALEKSVDMSLGRLQNT